MWVKKAVLWVCATLLCVVLAGCTVSHDTSANSSGMEISDMSDGGFILVYSNEKENLFFYREARTDVMYVLYMDRMGYAGMAGLEVMLSPDGTPLLYSEWVEMDSKAK